MRNKAAMGVLLAARHKLPMVYAEAASSPAGGLISYGPHFVDQFRELAGYVARGKNRLTYRL
jgi:hypothetical protein